MKVLLEIKDDKADFFLEVLKNFSFVKAKLLIGKNSQLLQELEQAVQNVNLAKQRKLQPKPLSELLNEKSLAKDWLSEEDSRWDKIL